MLKEIAFQLDKPPKKPLSLPHRIVLSPQECRFLEKRDLNKKTKLQNKVR